jgi:hypothetical protein
MPLSGEAIRMMNYVDDIAVTLRRIQAVLPSLNEEERARVSEYIRKSEPNYETVLEAIVEKEPVLADKK